MASLLGTAVGVLPGLGPIATISMLLPFTFGLPVDTAMIMLAGIFYGSQYGGSTTAILMNLPGEASSVVTTLDGHEMAKQGKAGRALAAAAIGSFFAGSVGTLFIVIAAPLLAGMALSFGPTEYFSLIVLGLVTSMVLTSGSLLTGFGMVLLGMLLGMIGTDVNSGAARYTFGSPHLMDGLDFVVIATGIFGLGDVLANLEDEKSRAIIIAKVTSLFPTREDWKRMWAPIVRGTGIGVDARRSARRRPAAVILFCLCAGKEDLAASRGIWSRAPLKALRLPRLPTMPLPRPRSFPC